MLKDIFIFVIAVILTAVYFLVKYNTQGDIGQVLTAFGGVLGAVLLVIISLTSILDALSDRGLIISKVYSERRDRKIFEMIRKIAQESLCQNDSILLAHQDELLKKILAVMQLAPSQYQEIPLLFRRLQFEKVEDESIYKDALWEICLNGNILQNLSTTPISKKKYNVSFYLNFTDILCNNFMQNDNANLDSMARIIRFLIIRYHRSLHDFQDEYMIEEKLRAENYKVAIPPNGNLLLGLKVASILHLNIIRFTGHEHYLVGKRWEGNLDSQDNILIIHDVLVTGDQIKSVIRECKDKKISNIEIYSLVVRTDKGFDGKKEIERSKIPFNYLLSLNDLKISKKKGDQHGV